MILSFTDEFGSRRFQPGIYLIDGLGDGGRGSVYPGMCHDRQEFVQARPRQSPGGASLRKRLDASPRTVMPFRISAMRVYKDIGIGRNQSPRPS